MIVNRVVDGFNTTPGGGSRGKERLKMMDSAHSGVLSLLMFMEMIAVGCSVVSVSSESVIKL